MFKDLKKNWSLFWHFRKIHLMRQFEFRTDFFFWGFVSAMWTGFNFFFFTIIIRVSGDIGGWNENQMYLLMSVFTILDAFTWSFFYHNMKFYSQYVFSGELSQFLVKPVDPQFMLMTQSNSYNNVTRLIIGVYMLKWSIDQLQLQINWQTSLIFIYIFCISMIMIYFLWFIISTCAFYVEKLDNINEIIPAMRRLWQVPQEIYTGIFSTIFTVILPLGLITSVPAKVLLGENVLPNIIYMTIFTIIIVIISKIFFQYSIKRYSSIGG